LADSDELSRGAALRALGRLQAPGAEERLLAVVRDSEASDDLRLDAAEGLAELGTPPAKAELEKLAQQDDELGQLSKQLLQEM
jgi:HEAT repeat protein